MIFFRFSTVSLRSTVSSNWPPVVGVMLTVISSLSTAAATQPHPGGGSGGGGCCCGVVVGGSSGGGGGGGGSGNNNGAGGSGACSRNAGAAAAEPGIASGATEEGAGLGHLIEWEENDRFSFDDSDRFEEDSLCSFSSEHESLCNNWRGWRRPAAGFGLSKKPFEGE